MSLEGTVDRILILTLTAALLIFVGAIVEVKFVFPAIEQRVYHEGYRQGIQDQADDVCENVFPHLTHGVLGADGFLIACDNAPVVRG